MSVYTNQVNTASSAVEEMAAAARSIGSQAEQKRTVIRGLLELSGSGESRLSSVKKSIDDVLAASEKMIETTRFIEDLASRTNLLGMNASIEAAHAGSAGRGFAIVAGQIRRLSEETGTSSQNISTILKTAKNAIEAAARENGEVLRFFHEISEAIGDVTGMMEELLASIQEISAGTGDVLKAVETVASLTGSTEKAVENSRESVLRSSGSIQHIEDISRSVKESSIVMADRFTDIQKNSEGIQALGNENLQIIAQLKNALAAAD